MNFKKKTLIGIALLLPFAAILISNASYYLPFFSDDSLISLRYVSRLLEGHGLTWTEGRPVEGYSNLLWILLVAFFGMIGVELISATRILGILGMIIIMFSMSYWYVRRYELRAIWFPLTIALLFLSVAAPIAVWAIGGLEQPLYGALIAVSIVLMYSVIESKGADKHKIFYLSLILGLLCITRPDGPIFTVASAASIFIIGRFYRRDRLVSSSLLVLTIPILFYAGQTLFRLSYYGEFFPNSALVKITPSFHYLLQGLKYLIKGFISLLPFSIIAVASLLAVVISTKNRVRGVYLLAISVMWSLYIVFIGGDIFPAYRHFIPLIVVFAFSLVEGFFIIRNHLIKSPSPKYRILFVVIGFILFIPYTYIQFTNTQNQGAVNELWEWQGKDIGLLLKDAFSAQQPLLAVTAAGCLPYWSELPALDMLGLNDYYLPRNPPEDIGNGNLGHELGDGKYILSRKPDIIIFNIGSESAFRSGDEMQGTAEFHKLYSPIKTKMSTENHLATIYFNKYSSKIGIQKSRSNIIVPGFLFRGENAIAYLNKANKLVVQVKSGQTVCVTFDSEFQQNWSVDVKSSDPDKIKSELKQDSDSLSITLSSKSMEPIEIEEVILRKNNE